MNALRVLRSQPGRTASAVLVVLFVVGTVGHLVPATRSFFLSLTPGFLPIAGLIALIPALTSDKRRSFVVTVCVAAIATFFIEVAGVATGAVFGAYHYGGSLGPKVLEVPLIIAFNWVLVVLGCLEICSSLKIPPALQVLLCAVATTAFDVVMEPVAVRLDFWTWDGGAIPMQNYVAWFVISLVLAAAWKFLKLRTRPWSVTTLIVCELVFFASLHFIV